MKRAVENGVSKPSIETNIKISNEDFSDFLLESGFYEILTKFQLEDQLDERRQMYLRACDARKLLKEPRTKLTDVEMIRTQELSQFATNTDRALLEVLAKNSPLTIVAYDFLHTQQYFQFLEKFLLQTTDNLKDRAGIRKKVAEARGKFIENTTDARKFLALEISRKSSNP